LDGVHEGAGGVVDVGDGDVEAGGVVGVGAAGVAGSTGARASQVQ